MLQSPFLHDWLFFHAERRPDAPAVATPSARLSYGDLATRVRSMAGHLAERGVGHGSRVLVALPNVPATVVAGLAIHSLSGIAVEVNRAWGPELLDGLVAQSGVRHAIVWGRDARTWSAVTGKRSLDHLWVVHPGPLPPPISAALQATSTVPW